MAGESHESNTNNNEETGELIGVTPAHTTQAIIDGSHPPSSDMQSLLDQFDPLSVKDKPLPDPQSRYEDEEYNEKLSSGGDKPEPVEKDEQYKNKNENKHKKQGKVEEESATEGSNDNTNMTEENTSVSQIQNSVDYQDNPSEDKPFDFNRFLGQLRHRSADPILRYLRSFLHEFNRKNWSTTEQVKIITDFKTFIGNKMLIVEPFKSLNDTELDHSFEGMEKLIMNRLYSQTFSPEISPERRSDDHEEDVIRDNVLTEKMRIWQWLEGRHLDLTDRFLINGEAFVKLASDELLKINHYRAPRDKIICILNCCKVIFGLLRQSKSEESADEFMPILIYVVIRAQPKNIISNVNYIQRFRNGDKLNGESGYYLSSLSGAISFIETLDRSQLSITDEEFEQNVESSVSRLQKNKVLDRVARRDAPPVASATNSNTKTPPHTPADSPSRTNATTVPGGMNPSQVLINSAGLLSSPLKSLSKIFEPEDEPSSYDSPATSTAQSSPQSNNTNNNEETPQESAAKQASAEEAEARRIHEAEFENVCDTLSQMFPTLDREIIGDVLTQQQGRVGAAVDSCLTLVGSSAM